MKFPYLLLSCLICIMTVSVSFAEYYNYTDENGVKHFTENISDVPEKFRPQVQIHRTIRTPADQESQKSDDLQENEEAQNKDKMTRAQLTAQKNALQQLYSTLLEKMETLKAQKKTMNPDEYNVLVQKLNDEIRIYQEKNKNYERQVKDYNSQFKTAVPEKEESSP